MMLGRWLSHIPPGELIFASFILMILSGTLILSFPFAQQESIPFIDLLFTVTSATCVTGQFTIPLSHFTLAGQTIILVLVQLGGLGLITLTIFLLSVLINLGLGTQYMAEQLLELDSWKRVKQLLTFIIAVTFVSEAVGAILLYPIFATDYPSHIAFFYAIFHAVSAFCSAGISLFPGEMQMYRDNYVVLIVVMMLMLIGGLGFITWYEIGHHLWLRSRKMYHRFSLHTKIVLYGSAALIVTTAATFWIVEYDHILAGQSFPLSITTALCNAISFRSTGFSFYAATEYQYATLLLIMIISFIGSSPGSTGSGIKITTFTILIATIKAAIFGSSSVDIRGRKIGTDQIYKTIGIISITLGWILFATFCLLITEKNWQFVDVLFECVTATTTIGLSTGNTANLSLIGKLFIMTSMLAGRIGSLALIMAIKYHKKKDMVPYQYPEERVMLG